MTGLIITVGIYPRVEFDSGFVFQHIVGNFFTAGNGV